MKKSFTLFKTLLVAATLLVGGASSVWADVINLSPSEATIIWGNGDGSKGEQYLNTNGDNNYYDAEATSWTCTQANISGGKLNNQNAAYGGSYAVIVKFNGSAQLEGMNIQKATLKFNSVCTVSGKNSNVIVSSLGTDWDATTVTWNSLDKTVTQISAGTGQNVKTSTKTLTEDVTTLLSDDDDKIVAFAIYTYTAREQRISDIVIEVEAVDASSSADVTLKYIDVNGDEIKTETAVASAGSTLALTDAQKDNFFKDDKKYIYVSDNSADITIAKDGSSVISLTYREAEIYNYSLLDNFGNIVTTGVGFEGETVDVAYPRYALIDGVFYEAPKTNDGKKQYRINISLNADNATNTITYSAKEGDVVFFAEAEKITGVTVTTAGNQPIRASNGAGATTDDEVAITTLPAGKYILHVGVFTSKPNNYGDFTVNFGVGSETYNAPITGVNMTEQKSGEYTITSGTEIKFLGITGDAQFDYIWIERTDAPQTVTIGADGFASFSSAKALDFTGTTIKAYVATAAADGVVTMSRVNKVPANTGLIIQGTTASVPVVDGEAETIAKNLLMPGTGANVLASTEGTYHYVFAKQSDKFGFYNLTADTKVEKGKAYLETTTALTAEARLVFVDETTGIANVNSQMNDVKSIFNLNGQRVEKAQKGLFIINGKKVLVK